VYEEVFLILDRAQKERSRSTPTRCDLALNLGNQGVFDLATTMHRLAIAVEEETPSAETGAGERTPQNEWIRDNPLLRPSSSKQKGKGKPKEYPLEAYELVLEEEDVGATRSGKANINGDEAIWALSCFLYDVDRIRKYCGLVWSSVVPDGLTSRITAAYVTNHAVHLTKQLEYDLLIDFPQFKNVHETQTMLFAQLSEYISVSLHSVYDLQEQLMINTWNALSGFGSILAENPIPIMKDGHFGYFNPSANRQSMSPGEKSRENACILLNYLPDLVMLDRNKISGILMGDHGLTKEFWTFLKDKSRPTSWTLLFCCQIFLEIVHARRRYLHLDVSAMRALEQKVCRELDDFMSDGVTYDDNMNPTKLEITAVQPKIHYWLGTDPLTKFKLDNKFDKLSKQACQMDSLWLMNPWLVANCITEAHMHLFRLGVGAAGSGGFVQSAMFLWNMLRQTGHLPRSESVSALVNLGKATTTSKEHVLVLDHLIDVYGDMVFSGPPPKDNFMNRFDLMLGVRPEAFAKNQRKYRRTVAVSRAHNETGRGMHPGISISYLMHDDKYAPKANLLESIINQASPALHPLAATRQIIDSELGQADSDDVRGLRGPMINLNMFKIHRLCVRLFMALEDALRQNLEEIFSVPYETLVKSQIQLPMITAYITATAEMTKDRGMDPTLLKKAGDVVYRILGTKEVAFYLMTEGAG
jgi:hypothetical protein